MDQHADHLALYQYGQPQGQLAPPLWLLHMNRHPEPVHRSHVYSSSVIYFPVEPTQWYVRARLRLNEFDMYSITQNEKCLQFLSSPGTFTLTQHTPHSHFIQESPFKSNKKQRNTPLKVSIKVSKIQSIITIAKYAQLARQAFLWV